MEIHRVYVEVESLFITASSLFYFLQYAATSFLPLLGGQLPTKSLRLSVQYWALQYSPA